MAILGIANYTTMVSLITFLQVYQEGYPLRHEKQEKRMRWLTVIIPVVIIAYYIYDGPAPPVYMHNISIAQPDNNLPPTTIDSRFLDFDGYFDIFDIVIHEDTRPCSPSCAPLIYLVDL